MTADIFKDVRPDPPPGRYYSVSQIRTFRRRPLAWYLDRVWYPEVPRKDTKASARGRRYHKALEHYIRTGERVEGFDRLWQLADDPDMAEVLEGLIPEAEIRMDLRPYGLGSENDPVRLWGFVDGHKGCGQEGAGVVFDLKTTARVSNALRPSQLSRDLQALTYAKASGYDPVRLVWGYVGTEGPADYDMVETWVTRAQIEAEWERTLETIREMERIRLLERPEDIVCNDGQDGRPFACKDFGGCRHQAVCREGVEKLVTIGNGTGNENRGDLLLINTVVRKGEDEPVLFEDWLAPIAEAFRTEFGRAWPLMKYREGTGPMAVSMARADVPPILALDRAHPLYSEAREALVPRYDVVLEGTR